MIISVDVNKSENSSTFIHWQKHSSNWMGLPHDKETKINPEVPIYLVWKTTCFTPKMEKKGKKSVPCFSMQYCNGGSSQNSKTGKTIVIFIGKEGIK